jgi:hypothetical protein
LILDSQADLNVYLTAAEESTNSGCCGTEADQNGCDYAKAGPQTELGISNLDLNEIAGMCILTYQCSAEPLFTMITGSFKIFAIKP